MAIIPQIAMGFQPPQFQAPQTANTLALISQLEGQREANALRQAQARKLQLEEQRQNALLGAVRGGQTPLLADFAAAGEQGLQFYEAIQKDEERKRKQLGDRQMALAEGLYAVHQDPSQENIGRVYGRLQERGMGEGLADSVVQLLFMPPEERKNAVMQYVQTTPGMTDRINAIAKAQADIAKTGAQTELAFAQARQAGQPEVPAGVKEAEWYRTATPEQRATYLELAAAKRPPGTTVVVPPGDKAEDTARGQSLVKEEESVATQAQAARRAVTSIESAQRVLNAGFRTGFGTETQAAAASFLGALGVKEAGKFATKAETFLKAAKENVLARQLEQKGVQTNQDAERIEQTFAQLGNTPEANQFILDIARAQAKRAIEQDQFYRKWVAERGTMRGARDAWMDQEGDKSLFERPELQKYGQPAESTPTGKSGVVDWGSLKK
jgi:hypothetical protein